MPKNRYEPGACSIALSKVHVNADSLMRALNQHFSAVALAVMLEMCLQSAVSGLSGRRSWGHCSEEEIHP